MHYFLLIVSLVMVRLEYSSIPPIRAKYLESVRTTEGSWIEGETQTSPSSWDVSDMMI